MFDATRPEYNTPEYNAWRFSVMKRDNFTCIMCGSRDKCQAHHIKRWVDAPLLRFLITNGVTLCKKDHDMVTGKERAFEAQFIKYVQEKKKDYLRMSGKTRGKWRPRNPFLRY